MPHFLTVSKKDSILKNKCFESFSRIGFFIVGRKEMKIKSAVHALQDRQILWRPKTVNVSG